jgi:hypothetical protein
MIDKKLLKDATMSMADLDRQVNVSLYLFLRYARSKNPFDIRQLTIGGDLIGELRKMAEAVLRGIEAETNAKELVDFNSDLEQERFFLEAKIIPDFDAIYKVLIQAAPPQYLNNRPKEEDLKAWAVRLEFMLDGRLRQLILFQRFSPSRMMKREGFWIFVQNGVYELAKNDFLSLRDEFHAVFLDEVMAVLDRKAFEAVFAFDQVYARGATTVLDILDQGRLNKEVSVANADILRPEFMTGKRSVRKLFRIHRSGYYKKIKMVELKKLNRRRKLQLTFSGNKWIITPQTDPEVVLSILNDDYNRSMITDNEYRVEGKEKLK